MLWEMYQQRGIHAAQSSASRAESKAQNVGHTIRLLEGKVDALALTCQAMWELLRDRSKLTEDDLIAKVNEIDLRDGREDGKMRTGGAPCPNCERIVNKRHERCMYCGEDVGKEHSFQH
jgi:rRNA maturation endonuclease Nob1